MTKYSSSSCMINYASRQVRLQIRHGGAVAPCGSHGSATLSTTGQSPQRNGVRALIPERSQECGTNRLGRLFPRIALLLLRGRTAGGGVAVRSGTSGE